MKFLFRIYIIFLFSAFSLESFSQERVTTFGLQLKPIIPLGFFDTGKQQQTINNIAFTLNPNLGLNFGMVIRKGFTKSLSLETGINFLRRNYDINISDLDSNTSESSSFKLVNYEIPILGLIYVQLGELLYMNVSGGASLDVYPSDLIKSGDNHYTELVRNRWLQASLVANIGWEYRTYKDGYFYIGASLHRPFSEAFNQFIVYNDGGAKKEISFYKLSGNYITIDFRYFFHENKVKKKRKTKKSSR